jgi:hypothetical protein
MTLLSQVEDCRTTIKRGEIGGVLHSRGEFQKYLHHFHSTVTSAASRAEAGA